MKVFYILIGLTIIELFFVELPRFVPDISKLLVTILVCAASLAKAVYVGWYFMHLNHETPWLRKLVLLSMICFFYAAVLIPDTIMDRPMVKYIPEPVRVFKNDHKAEEAAKKEAAPEAANAAAVDAAQVQDTAAQPQAEGAVDGAAAPAEAPADAGSEEWN